MREVFTEHSLLVSDMMQSIFIVKHSENETNYYSYKIDKLNFGWSGSESGPAQREAT